MSDLERRIERLEQIEAVRNIVMRYAWAADKNNDAEMMTALLDENAVWESPQFGRFAGLDEIIPAMAEASRKTIRWAIHYMISPAVELDETLGEAVCRWYLWEPAKVADENDTPHDTWMGGKYEARLRRGADDKWRFTHIFLDMTLLSKVGEPWNIKVEGA